MEEVCTRNQNFIAFTENIIKHNKISHAYIFEVCNYEKDLILINNFIKIILCQNGCVSFEKLNCGKCNLCNLIDNCNYPDIKYIEPDGKDIKKEQLVDIIKDYGNKSLFNNKRVYVIKEAERLNMYAANTLLKFLEEPADDVIAILLTTNRYKIIDTILSRCQVLTVGDEKIDIEYFDNTNNFISYILNASSLFVHYNDILKIIPDKATAVPFLIHIENIFIIYLEKGISLFKAMEDADRAVVMKSLKIIATNLENLEYNVNYKLWLDSLFAKLIGGDDND